MYTNRKESLKLRALRVIDGLDNLLPVGTINFVNVPVEKYSFYSIPVNNHSDWKWLDIDFLESVTTGKLHPILLDILFLVKYLFCRGTFKVFKSIDNQLQIFKLRLYAVPSDIKDSRYIYSWRARIPGYTNNILQLEKNTWFNVISVLSFDDLDWFQLHSPVTLFDFNSTSFIPHIESVDNIIQRWISNGHYSPPKHILKPESDLQATVIRIYNSIRSPNLSEYENKAISNKDIFNSENVIINLLKSQSIPGVVTALYPFQVKSICKMLEQETSIRSTIGPNFIKLKSPGSSNIYYYDLLYYKFRMYPDIYRLPKGGILAENMGLGKTLICLSLICLTKFEISKIPEDLLLYHEVNYNSREVRSLTELCKRTINLNSLPWKYYSNDLPLSVKTALHNDPGYFRIVLKDGSYDKIHSLRTRTLPKRIQTERIEGEGITYRTLYLCNTTLVIVPDNLFHQWINEIKKHILTNFLNKLYISSQINHEIKSEYSTHVNEIPDNPRYLIAFDLIIITASFLSRKIEENANSFDNVYWKRLIIDEGHSMNTKYSKISKLCSSLMAERMWAVTGTPTSGLTNLYMDEEQMEAENIESAYKKKTHKNRYVVKNQFDARKDLSKLGTIIGNFLKLEPYNLQPKLWKKNILEPIEIEAEGADIKLINLLNYLVVRHREELDVKLPQLHHDAIFIEPSFHNKLSVDLFTAVLAANAVSSERTDMDYMFHPSNRQQLRRLITNLQRATFHWTGFKQEDIETLISICELCLEKKSLDYSEYDISLLQKSIAVSKLALSNPRWRTSSLLHEMNYFVSGLPKIFNKYFGIGAIKSDNISVFGAPHMSAVQEFVYKHRFMDMNDEENLNSKLEEASKEFWLTYWLENVKRNEERFNKQDTNQDFSGGVSIEKIQATMNTPRIARDNKPSIPLDKNGERKHQKYEIQEDARDGFTPEAHSNDFNMSFQTLKNAEILGTASSKLSYLGSRLLEHQRNKIKSLIFFEFEDSAYYLAELLDILGVNYILYATFINPPERANNLYDFTNYDSETLGGITLIMDLRLAAHGLTVIAATHVYFISPVWQRSVEAQAIKRSHRIGQTKEVYVQTLILRGTLEEEIYKQRSDGSGKYLIDNKLMQDFVLRHTFLNIEPGEVEYCKFVSPIDSSLGSNSLVETSTENEEYALSTHTEKVSTTNLVREWAMKVFTRENLDKLNNQKARKSLKLSSKKAFIDNFMNDTDVNPISTSPKKRLIVDNGSRKKVRF